MRVKEDGEGLQKIFLTDRQKPLSLLCFLAWSNFIIHSQLAVVCYLSASVFLPIFLLSNGFTCVKGEVWWHLSECLTDRQLESKLNGDVALSLFASSCEVKNNLFNNNPTTTCQSEMVEKDGVCGRVVFLLPFLSSMNPTEEDRMHCLPLIASSVRRKIQPLSIGGRGKTLLPYHTLTQIHI